MKLDKDIHTRLVNPQTSTTLESNVKNVLVALNGKAPYDRLIKMIESIKVWTQSSDLFLELPLRPDYITYLI